jgi:serine O-acetyltransferase
MNDTQLSAPGIKSRRDFSFFLEADRLALSRERSRPKILGDSVWKFERVLRFCEYLRANGGGIHRRLLYGLALLRLRRMGLRLGFSIPLGVFGPGLSIAHYGTIVVNGNARIGENCRLHVCVVIGASGGTRDAPQIGNNVYIGPGAKIYGGIRIADGIAIGANAVVNASIEEAGITVGGVPARKIGDGGSAGLLVRATELLRERDARFSIHTRA